MYHIEDFDVIKVIDNRRLEITLDKNIKVLKRNRNWQPFLNGFWEKTKMFVLSVPTIDDDKHTICQVVVCKQYANYMTAENLCTCVCCYVNKIFIHHLRFCLHWEQSMDWPNNDIRILILQHWHIFFYAKLIDFLITPRMFCIPIDCASGARFDLWTWVLTNGIEGHIEVRPFSDWLKLDMDNNFEVVNHYGTVGMWISFWCVNVQYSTCGVRLHALENLKFEDTAG